MKEKSASELLKRMKKGEPFALSRLITLLENGDESLLPIMEQISDMGAKGYSIGITGPPGSGKSTLIDILVQLLRIKGEKVGVLAIDPSSPFSGGALLGDRIRMQKHALDSGVFIRSLATRGISGGLSRSAAEALSLLFVAGFDIGIVETVGVGQTELRVMEVADTVVVVLVPEAGGAIQVMKAGIMEIADIFVINKSDRPGAETLKTEIEDMIEMRNDPYGWRPPVVMTVAREGKGVDELLKEIRKHRDITIKSGLRKDRRSAEVFLKRVLVQEFVRWFDKECEKGRGLAWKTLKDVMDGSMNPYTAVRLFLSSLKVEEQE